MSGVLDAFRFMLIAVAGGINVNWRSSPISAKKIVFCENSSAGAVCASTTTSAVD
jgi:hypothetical protein